MKRVEINKLQKEMKRVYDFGYDYTRRDPTMDSLTNFVFSIDNFDDLMVASNLAFPEWNLNREKYISYAMTRWYKRMSATFSEAVFVRHPNILKASRDEDRRHIDFYMNNIPFDLKNTMFPKVYATRKKYALRHPAELAKWLMDNQADRRFSNYHNQIFIVYDSSYRPNWMMKAELFLTQRKINKWVKLRNRKPVPEIVLSAGCTVKADVIFVTE
jgi:hypothetical protein